MQAGSRFTRRLALAISAFEVCAATGAGTLRIASPWQAVFVVAAPLGIYGLLLPLASRIFDRRSARRGAWALFAAFAAAWAWRHRVAPLSSAGAAAAAGLGLGAAALAWLPLRADAWLRWALPACLLPAAASWMVWTSAAAAAWIGPSPSAAPPSAAPNLVLVSWDTVRADVLRIHGGSGTDTPHLDRLAAEGCVFEDAAALTSITGPSHACMLTGRYPMLHGVRTNGGAGIDPGVPTLAEILHAAGYRTGGFVSAFPMLGKFGFARGFELYDDRLPGSRALEVGKLGRSNFLWLWAAGPFLPKAPDASLPGAAVNERAFAWLDGAQGGDVGRPYFLFVHYYDAHGPFDPEEPWRTAAAAAAPTAQPAARDPRAADEMSRYRAEIAQVDALFGALRERLERRDPGLRNTLILLTSDHGECFGEGGIVANLTASLFEATQHVPLVMRFPDAAGAGMRVRATATHLDILPSLLAAAGVPPPEGFEGPGQQLARLDALRPPGSPPRGVYMEAQQTSLGDQRKIGWRADRRKLVRWQTGMEQLWSFEPSAAEGADLGAAEPELRDRMRAALDAFLRTVRPAGGASVAIGAEDRAALKALGYAYD
jgi:arylsulfatase